ncbi:MAG: hypothetical protein PHZ04_02840 [Patescibacteria group bacterium]|nr:hypothetical protein [Patescibacteria group bacterium]MDD5295218.1 hypothetical protein [Patescibacteria group bacterium]MDD5554593.1 hypothetical protein [Patescibacteria group bacterium]
MSDIFCSDIWGGPATLVKVGSKRMVILADGTLVDYDEKFLSSKDLARTAKDTLRGLLNNSVIPSGRPVAIRALGLKAEQCQNGAIYRIKIFPDGRIEAEVAVTGVFLEDAKTREAAAHV